MCHQGTLEVTPRWYIIIMFKLCCEKQKPQENSWYAYRESAIYTLSAVLPLETKEIGLFVPAENGLWSGGIDGEVSCLHGSHFYSICLVVQSGASSAKTISTVSVGFEYAPAFTSRWIKDFASFQSLTNDMNSS